MFGIAALRPQTRGPISQAASSEAMREYIARNHEELKQDVQRAKAALTLPQQEHSLLCSWPATVATWVEWLQGNASRLEDAKAKVKQGCRREHNVRLEGLPSLLSCE